MRQQWNERAQIDPYHHVLNRKQIGEWTAPEFLKTGEENCKRFLDPFINAHKIRTRSRTCLEIGCGAGRESGALAQRFKTVIALDVSDEMLNTARQNVTAGNVEFVRGNGINLDVVETNSVSFVYSVIVFQHIPDVDVQYEYLREVARVLRPGGWFLIHLYNDEAGYAVKLRKWQERADVGDVMGWSEAARRELEDNRFLTSMQTPVNRDTALALLAECGLEVVHDDGAGTFAWWIGGHK